MEVCGVLVGRQGQDIKMNDPWKGKITSYGSGRGGKRFCEVWSLYKWSLQCFLKGTTNSGPGNPFFLYCATWVVTMIVKWGPMGPAGGRSSGKLHRRSRKSSLHRTRSTNWTPAMQFFDRFRSERIWRCNFRPLTDRPADSIGPQSEVQAQEEYDRVRLFSDGFDGQKPVPVHILTIWL